MEQARKLGNEEVVPGAGGPEPGKITGGAAVRVMLGPPKALR